MHHQIKSVPIGRLAAIILAVATLDLIGSPLSAQVFHPSNSAGIVRMTGDQTPNRNLSLREVSPGKGIALPKAGPTPVGIAPSPKVEPPAPKGEPTPVGIAPAPKAEPTPVGITPSPKVEPPGPKAEPTPVGIDPAPKAGPTPVGINPAPKAEPTPVGTALPPSPKFVPPQIEPFETDPSARKK